MRDMYQYGNITLEEINRFFDNYILIDGKIVLKNVATVDERREKTIKVISSEGE